MPRVSRKQAELNREIIVDAASRLFREQGLHGVSLADVMAAAGLTHGGFYGHFASREALAAEACAQAFEQSTERWQTRVDENSDRDAARAALIDPYLSAANRDNAGEGCPIAAFVGDICHEADDSVLQHTFIHGVETSLDVFVALQPDGDRQAALAQYAMMVGAVSLARATRGNGLSDEFLDAARSVLLPEKP